MTYVVQYVKLILKHVPLATSFLSGRFIWLINKEVIGDENFASSIINIIAPEPNQKANDTASQENDITNSGEMI